MSTEHPDRPIGLWIVPILAILLGGLGSCGGTFGLASLAVQDSLIEIQENLQQQDPNPRAREFNREINRASLEVARQWRIPSAAANVVNVVASFILLIAGILIFRWHPRAPMIFIVAACISIVADLVLGGIGVVVQQQTMSAIQEVTANGGIGGDPATERMMNGVMRASGTFGLCFALGWLAAKLGVYIGGIVYLRKGTVRTLFG